MNHADAINIIAESATWRALEDWEEAGRDDTLPDISEHDYNLVTERMAELLPKLTRFSLRSEAYWGLAEAFDDDRED